MRTIDVMHNALAEISRMFPDGNPLQRSRFAGLSVVLVPYVLFWIKMLAAFGMLFARVLFVPYGGYLVFVVLPLNRYVAFAQGISSNTMNLEGMRIFGQSLLRRYLRKLEIALAICKNRSLGVFGNNNLAGTGTTN